MNVEALVEWVNAWADRYPREHDEPVERLGCPPSLDRDAWQVVLDWKFAGMPHRRANAERAIRSAPASALEDVSGAAHKCRDDDHAMRLIRVLDGVGHGLGSAALMVMDPERFTVLDVRAAASVRALGEDVPAGLQRDRTWPFYLHACHDLANRAGVTLRHLDRALYQANGDAKAPTL